MSVIFRQDILTTKWGMSFGDMVDYWMLLVHFGLIDATEDDQVMADGAAEWGMKADGKG